MGTRQDPHGRVLDLIGQVYDAALDERLWPHLAPRIAETFAATSTALHTRDIRRGSVDLLGLTENFRPEYLASYEEYYAPRDVWVERALKVGPARIVASKDLIADPELERTEIYNDWFRLLDIYYVVGSVFPVAGDEIGVIGIHRPHASSTFDEPDKALVGCFVPHLQGALQLRRRLGEVGIVRGAAIETLDRSATATLVVDGEGRVVHANSCAERLLHGGDGVRGLRGRVIAESPAAQMRLARLIREAAATAAGQGDRPAGTMAIPRPERLPLTVMVAPLRAAGDGFGLAVPAAIVFIRDPEASTLAVSALRDLFGLTAAEARLAGELADGHSLEQAAAGLRVTLNTVRTHLKGVFAKTGTSRQPQLVSLLLRSVAAMR